MIISLIDDARAIRKAFGIWTITGSSAAGEAQAEENFEFPLWYDPFGLRMEDKFWISQQLS